MDGKRISPCTQPCTDYFSLMAKVERMEERMVASDKALDLAATTAQAQYHSLNELRKEVIADRALCVAKETYEVQHGDIAGRVDRLAQAISNMDVRVGKWEVRIILMSSGFLLLIAVVGLALRIKG